MSSNEEIIKELNTLKKEYNPYANKDRAIEIQNKVKQILQDASDGTEMYRVVKETSSGWTSHGSYSDTRAVMKKLKKENGVWEMYGRKRDTIDDAMWSILYNEGDLMTKADAQSELAKQKESDVSTHRDIVNVGTDNAGNPVGKSTNRVDYPNKKEESTDASHLKIENVTPIYTGGGIYIYTGELSDGNYFIASDQSFAGDYFDIRIVDENPADYEEDFCDVTWQEEHLVSDVVGGEAREFTIQLLEWVLENHPEGNYQLGDIEAMLDSIQNKVEESKKICENTSSVDWEEENFDLIWDEYAKRKSKELGVTRDEIPEWGEEGFDEELYNEVAWELYNSDAGLPDPDMYMESKEPRSMSREDIMSCYISDITEAAYTYTPQEAQEEINNILDDLKNDKDLDDVDKRFILKMVRGTLLNKDIKFTEITENKKVEAKYGDSNPDKIVPDAYCEIEKTDKGYYINCGIGTHTNLGSGNFTIYPEDYLSNLHKEVKKLAKERGIKRVYDKVKTMIPEYNAMIPEYNANIEDMIKNLTPFAEKSKQGRLTRADLDSIEEITGKITPNRMSTLPEFEWSGKFGRLRSLIGNLERYKTDLSNPLASADTITITESKEVKTEATLSKFQTLTVDKDGNEMLLKDVSYNNACSWLEKELAKAGSKVVDTEIKGNKTIIKADNKTKFEYDEEKGTLKRLEETKSKEDEVIWNKVEKIVDLVDTEIEPDSNDEFDYDEHITFVFYRDLEDIDMYEVYTYLDGEIQEDLDTGDVHISDLDSTLVDIVKKLKEVN